MEDNSDVYVDKIVIGPGFCAGGRLALILGSYIAGAKIISYYPGGFDSYR